MIASHLSIAHNAVHAKFDINDIVYYWQASLVDFELMKFSLNS